MMRGDDRRLRDDERKETDESVHLVLSLAALVAAMPACAFEPSGTKRVVPRPIGEALVGEPQAIGLDKIALPPSDNKVPPYQTGDRDNIQNGSPNGREPLRRVGGGFTPAGSIVEERSWTLLVVFRRLLLATSLIKLLGRVQSDLAAHLGVVQLRAPVGRWMHAIAHRSQFEVTKLLIITASRAKAERW